MLIVAAFLILCGVIGWAIYQSMTPSSRRRDDLEHVRDNIFRRVLIDGELRLWEAATSNVTVTPRHDGTCTIVSGTDARIAPLGHAAFDARFRVPGPRSLAYARMSSGVRAALLRFAHVRVDNSVVEAAQERFSSADIDALITIYDAAQLTPLDVSAELAKNFAEEPEPGVREGILRVLEREAPQSGAFLRALEQAQTDADPELRLFARARLDPHRLAPMALDGNLPRAVRATAIDELVARAGENAARQLLSQLLGNDDWDMRWLAARLARTLRYGDAAFDLQEWLQDPRCPPTLLHEALDTLEVVAPDYEACLLALLPLPHAQRVVLAKLSTHGSARSTAQVEALTRSAMAEEAIAEEARAALSHILARLPAALNGALSVSDPLGGAVSETPLRAGEVLLERK